MIRIRTYAIWSTALLLSLTPIARASDDPVVEKGEYTNLGLRVGVDNVRLFALVYAGQLDLKTVERHATPIAHLVEEEGRTLWPISPSQAHLFPLSKAVAIDRDHVFVVAWYNTTRGTWGFLALNNLGNGKQAWLSSDGGKGIVDNRNPDADWVAHRWKADDSREIYLQVRASGGWMTWYWGGLEQQSITLGP